MRLLHMDLGVPLEVGSCPAATAHGVAVLPGRPAALRRPAFRAHGLLAPDLAHRRAALRWRGDHPGAPAAPRWANTSQAARPFPELHRERIPVGRRASLAALAAHTRHSEAQREQAPSGTPRAEIASRALRCVFDTPIPEEAGILPRFGTRSQATRTVVQLVRSTAQRHQAPHVLSLAHGSRHRACSQACAIPVG